MNIVARVALTPALSQRERENQPLIPTLSRGERDTKPVTRIRLQGASE